MDATHVVVMKALELVSFPDPERARVHVRGLETRLEFEPARVESGDGYLNNI